MPPSDYRLSVLATAALGLFLLLIGAMGPWELVWFLPVCYVLLRARAWARAAVSAEPRPPSLPAPRTARQAGPALPPSTEAPIPGPFRRSAHVPAPRGGREIRLTDTTDTEPPTGDNT